ncbi:MAG: GNAT family N-acetyltransferase [Acidobacteria bacterium]|nr:GNAT family N-acetyltransferase [Acidobacteriota bacterium]
MTEQGTLRIRPALAADVPMVLRFIRELADYEESLHRVLADEELLRESLFGETRRAEAILGDVGEEAVAFAVFYHSFSTYLGRHCLHLEDLYVRSDRRGGGIGRIMLAYLARVAKQRRCVLMEWSSLAWNEAAKQFYLHLGAEAEERSMYRLSGKSLDRLANRKE